MKITLLGDSIRQQYAPRVAELLGKDFEVWHPNENCRFSKYTLRGLFEWSKCMEGSDIVHWNNGLWDICDLWGDGVFTPDAEYIDNMMRILDILQKNHKAVIFATTTPVRNENQYDKNENIERFNGIIVPKLKERGVIINDLYSLLQSDVYKYICDDNIHLTQDGIELCAKQVVNYIKSVKENIDNTNNVLQSNNYDKNGVGAPALL